MQRLARQDSNTAAVRWLANEIRFPASLDSALRSVWEYVPDPPGVEYVASPDLQIVRALDRLKSSGVFRLWGDCDEAATLAASLLLRLGEPSRIVAIRIPGAPLFGHVFLRWSGGDIDPTVPADVLPISNYEESMELDVY